MRRTSTLLTFALLLAGCGGGGGGHASRTRTGRVAFTVNWPARTSRFIPAAATLIRAVLKDGDGNVKATLDFTSPGAGGGTTTQTVPNLEEGDYTIRADAYQAAATENPLSSGNANVTVVAEKTVESNVILASTLSKFRATLRDLVNGGEITSELDGSTPGTALKPNGVYEITIQAQNAGGGDLALFPSAANRTVISATGFDVVAPTALGATLKAYLSPKSLGGSTSIVADYLDGTAALSKSLSPNLAPVSAAFNGGFVALDSDATPSLAVHPAQSYAVVKQTQFKLYEFDNINPIENDLGAAGVVSTDGTAQAYGVVADITVNLRTAGGTNSISITGALRALAPYRAEAVSANYAASGLGGDLIFSLLNPAGSATVVATVTPSVSPTTITAFGVGYDAATGAPAFTTLEGTAVRRYVKSGSGYVLDGAFAPPSIASPAALAVDGNLVTVLSADGKLTFLNARGSKMGESSALSAANASAISADALAMAAGKGAIAYKTAAGPDVYKTRRFDY